MYADKYVNQLSDIPTEPHWAIITTTSIHIPGDERSRKHPGHGYPASTETSINYEVYLTQQKWQQAIEELESTKYGRKEYRAIHVEPASIKRSITVE